MTTPPVLPIPYGMHYRSSLVLVLHVLLFRGHRSKLTGSPPPPPSGHTKAFVSLLDHGYPYPALFCAGQGFNKLIISPTGPCAKRALGPDKALTSLATLSKRALKLVYSHIQ